MTRVAILPMRRWEVAPSARVPARRRTKLRSAQSPRRVGGCICRRCHNLGNLHPWSTHFRIPLTLRPKVPGWGCGKCAEEVGHRAVGERYCCTKAPSCDGVRHRLCRAHHSRSAREQGGEYLPVHRAVGYVQAHRCARTSQLLNVTEAQSVMIRSRGTVVRWPNGNVT